jgi:CRP/FNR family transcriptional regulator
MNKEDFFPVMRNSAIFTHLTDQQLLIIFNKLQLRTLPAHQIFIEQDDQTVEAYLITSGSIRVYRTTESGDEVTLAFKGPGELVGEMALLDERPRSAYVETIQPTTVLTISRNDFRRIIFEYPEIAINLLKTLTQRLRETNQHLEEEVSQDLANRTWNVLKALAPYFPNQEITMSQEELANTIGATRARVTEVLDQFQTQGKITLSHRKIRLI